MTIAPARPRRGRAAGPSRWLATGLVALACAGGGGSTQTAPDAVRAGEPATVQLQLSVWGSGGGIAGRYTGVALYYRLGGAADYQRAPEPRRVAVDGRHETYEFTIPPFPVGTRGAIEYYFTVTLDGNASRIPGMKQIRVE